MYYIGTKNQCDYYNDKVGNGENYNGTTQRWATPIQHPTDGRWAIVKHKDYTHSTMELVESLSSDWFETEEI